MKSMRRYLVVLLLSIMVVGDLLLTLASFSLVRHEVNELFDAEQASNAKILNALITGFLENGNTDAHELARIQESIRLQWKEALQDDASHDEEEERFVTGHRYERKLAFQWVRDDKVLIRSENAPAEPWVHSVRGYSDTLMNDYVWHLFTLREANSRVWLTIAERDDVRQEMIHTIAMTNLKPVLLGLPLMLIVVMVVLHRGLAPLENLASLIRSRDREKLDPVIIPRAPVEITPIVDALNTLLFQLKNSLEAERRFTSLASHELRTPVAVVKLAIQNTLNEHDPEKRQQLLLEAEQGVDRAGRLINQILTLARLEQDSHGFELRRLDLVEICREEIAALVPLALQKYQNLSLECEQDHVVLDAIPQLLPLLARNLVDNAIKYTPEKGSICVRIRQNNTDITLEVADSGAGVDEQFYTRLFDRFYRVNPNQGTGSGLGLALVKRVVDLHHATIGLSKDTGLGGLCVTIQFSGLRNVEAAQTTAHLT